MKAGPPVKRKDEACLSGAIPTLWPAAEAPAPMRSLLEIVLLGAVVALAWEKPISERVGEVIPALADKKPAVAAMRAMPVLAAAPAETPSGAWMWDPNRRSVLDRPAYDPKQRAAWAADEYGRHYWIDGEGKRHYER